MYTLIMRDREGSRHDLLYNPHTSDLTWPDGRPVVEGTQANWSDSIKVTPDQPGKKIDSPKRLKIQLGLGCNYSCSYCLQSAEITKAAASSTRDAEIFLKTLDVWMTGTPERIEYWGGEPLLYWHKIAVLVPELKRRYPDAQMVMITNGTLFTKEIVDQLDAWDFSVGISHDGPGQSLRGPDPFDDPEVKANIDYAVSVLSSKHRMSFNAVLTPMSYDVDAVIDWFKARYPDVEVSFEGVVHDYDGATNNRFTDAELANLTNQLAVQIMNQTATRTHAVRNKMQDFIQSLQKKRPSSALYQKCGMDRDDFLAVDLLGNVITCQNTGSEGRHRLGHVRSMDKVALTTATHFSHKEECMNCPVLQLCKGACMYLEGDHWTASCSAEFSYNMAMFAGTLFHLTHMVLERIEGDIVRPSYSSGD